MIVTQPKELIAEFVSHICDGSGLFGEYTALAKVDNTGIVVGVIYNNFTTDSSRKIINCEMHVAARPGAKWATREFLFHAFNYPFNEMGCKRVTGLVKEDNTQALKTNYRLGFKKEGVIRKGMDDQDLILLGMLRSECRFLDFNIKK